MKLKLHFFGLGTKMFMDLHPQKYGGGSSMLRELNRSYSFYFTDMDFILVIPLKFQLNLHFFFTFLV